MYKKIITHIAKFVILKHESGDFMATHIKSMKDLKKVVEGRLALAMKFTQQEIYEVIQKHIKDYYEEKVFRGGSSAIPKVYDRTYQFLNSLIKTDIATSGGKVSCSVKIDMDSLDYIQSAETVINMINEGYHAYVALNDSEYETPYDIPAKGRFWDDAMDELGGYDGILDIMKKNCRKVGLNIR